MSSLLVRQIFSAKQVNFNIITKIIKINTFPNNEKISTSRGLSDANRRGLLLIKKKSLAVILTDRRNLRFSAIVCLLALGITMYFFGSLNLSVARSVLVFISSDRFTVNKEEMREMIRKQPRTRNPLKLP